MSRSATRATRNEATTRWKRPKRTTSAELPIGTAVRPSRERLRTVADGWATSSEHTLNPQTPRVKREPLLRIRETAGKRILQVRTLYIYIKDISVWLCLTHQPRITLPRRSKNRNKDRPANTANTYYIYIYVYVYIYTHMLTLAVGYVRNYICICMCMCKCVWLCMCIYI